MAGDLRADADLRAGTLTAARTGAHRRAKQVKVTSAPAEVSLAPPQRRTAIEYISRGNAKIRSRDRAVRNKCQRGRTGTSADPRVSAILGEPLQAVELKPSGVRFSLHARASALTVARRDGTRGQGSRAESRSPPTPAGPGPRPP